MAITQVEIRNEYSSSERASQPGELSSNSAAVKQPV